MYQIQNSAQEVKVHAVDHDQLSISLLRQGVAPVVIAELVRDIDWDRKREISNRFGEIIRVTAGHLPRGAVVSI